MKNWSYTIEVSIRIKLKKWCSYELENHKNFTVRRWEELNVKKIRIVIILRTGIERDMESK